jgi:hypothetical protein
MKNKTRLFQKTGGDFIDIEDTGSYIRYKTHVIINHGKTPDKDYLDYDFSMSLGDCSRVITWDFEDYACSDSDLKLEKMDIAIDILHKAREDLRKAKKIADKARAKIEKAKSKVKKEEKDGD